ncbi:major facilitator superfamily domain-containing protein [Sordaria brevicollis]|uniref:Major facilitator superfamily domain-containing protein n=1 Tax=Sordaria brevicollis TaxID=83679 RepID=A0AAE0NVK6_SORBR|nr:major facilitator superfamily domain-containing protein [Sordaria brevicollis]
MAQTRPQSQFSEKPEKAPYPDSTTPPESTFFESSTGTVEPEWDPKAEARAVRKADQTVLPLLFLGLLVFQLDRMNIASALTNGFHTSIGVSTNVINLGNQLMFIGIVVLEIPSNMLLQRWGPRKWISAQVFLFGLVASLQPLIKNKTGFLVSRAILGLCEAGYIPGAVYTLSKWYRSTELGKRVAVLFFGMFGGNAISPLLGAGILRLDGERGMKGWQWLFLLEGLFTICVSILLLFFLPGSPRNPRPLLSPGLIRFSPTDSAVLVRRLERDHLHSGSSSSPPSSNQPIEKNLHIPPSLVWKTLTHHRRWPHYFSTFAVFSTWSSLTTYTPSILLSLGWSRTSSNALACVGAFLSLLTVFIFAWLSDRTGKRGATVVLAQVCYLVVLIVCREVQRNKEMGELGRWSRWGLWTAVNAFAVGYHPVHNTWVQLNCRDERERSVGIAMWVMSAILGLMAGTQYYRMGDGPFYERGLLIQICMVAAGIFFALMQIGIYVVHNRRVAEGKVKPGKDGEEPQVYVP